MGRRKPGATIHEVAHEAGVSPSTVSRVHTGSIPASPETQRRVQDAIARLRYRPSSLGRGLRQRRTSATGLVLPTLNGPYFTAIMLGYEHEAVAAHHSVVVLGTEGREQQSEELVLDLADRVDGMIVMGRCAEDEVLERLKTEAVPVVLLARPSVAGIPSVRAANFAPAAELTAHLIGHGHRDIAFLGDPELADDAGERWEGFKDAFLRAGLEPPDPVLTDSFNELAGYEAACHVLDSRHRPTALQCVNDETAVGACWAARERGLDVPGDLAITGWDDGDLSLAGFLAPSLTTVRQPIWQLGVQCFQLLMRRIVGDDALPADNVLPAQIVIRSSCGCTNSESERG